MDARPTNLGFALLGLLHEAPRSGYDLRKVFAETALGNYSSSPGAIYPALARLERQGLVDGEEDRTQALRPRKVYHATAAGTGALREWLARDVTRADVSRGLDELMLRFAFHWVLDSAAETRRFLGTLATELEAYVEELVGQRTLLFDAMPIHSRLALEQGIEQYRASARWARHALRQFEEAPS
jgi:DNA-binding PadR family transcriptional regulator